MENLYEELWGKEPQLPIVENLILNVPSPRHGVRPGYKMPIELGTMDKVFPAPNPAHASRVPITIIRVKSRVPVGKQKLLVRTEYKHIMDKLVKSETERFSASGILGGFAKRDFKIAGQPGCGKSVFLLYLLVKRLMMRQPTVYRRNDARCYLFDETHKGTEVNAKFLFNLAEQRNPRLWILTDACLTDERWNIQYYHWFIVLAASPTKMQESWQWEKDRKAGVHYMTNWRWNEIYSAFWLERATDKPITTVEVVRLYTIFTYLGPIARVCLNTIAVQTQEAFDNDWEQYVDMIDKEIEYFVAQGAIQSLNNSVHNRCSHKMAIMDPNANRLSYTARITTRWIAHRFLEVGLRFSQQKCFELYKQLAGQTKLRSAAGWFFEKYAHDLFRRGGEFTADELPIISSTSIPLVFRTEYTKSVSPNYFTNEADLAKLVNNAGGHGISNDVVGKYFLPYAHNQASFDGLVFITLDTVVLLQMTIAESHAVKNKGLKDLFRCLPRTITNIYIVFVIPDDRIQNYTTLQIVPNARFITNTSQIHEIRQFRLALMDDDLLFVAAQGTWEVEDEIQETVSDGESETDEEAGTDEEVKTDNEGF